LEGVSLIYVRESFSLNFCHRILKSKNNIYLSQDLAFYFSVQKPIIKVDPVVYNPAVVKRRKIGITVVNWPFSGSQNSESLLFLYKKNIANLVSYIEFNEKCPVVFVNQVQSDIPLAVEISDMADSGSVLTDERTVSEHLDLIGSFDYFIGSRFHSCIFAMLESVPFVALSYLPKVSEIMNDLGLSDLCLNLYALQSPDDILNHYLKCSSSLEASKTTIYNSVSKYINQPSPFSSMISSL